MNKVVDSRKNKLQKVYEKRFVRKKFNKKANITKNKLKFVILVIFLFATILFLIKVDKLLLSDFIGMLEDRINSLKIGDGFPYEIKGNNVLADNFDKLNGNIAILTDTTFETINPSARFISSRPHNFSNPVMKSGGNKVIIYDAGGFNYKIEECSKNILTNSSKNKIICASLAGNGSHGIVTDSSAYLSQLHIINRDGSEKYSYNFADCYVCNITMRNDGKSAAVCGLSSVGGEIKSKIYVFNFFSDEPEYVYECSDNMILSVEYISKKKLIVIGDKSANILDISNNSTQEFPYNSKKLQCTHIDKNFGIIYCLTSSNNDKKCELIAIDKCGKIHLKKEIDTCLNNILYKNGKILGTQNDIMYIYDMNGNLEKSLNLGATSSKILALSSNKILILDKEKIKEIQII